MPNHFFSVEDCPDPIGWVHEALKLKNNPFKYKRLGINKTLGLIFFNASLRTRLSTIKAAQNLGMETMLVFTGKRKNNLNHIIKSGLVTYQAKNIYEGFEKLCH